MIIEGNEYGRSSSSESRKLLGSVPRDGRLDDWLAAERELIWKRETRTEKKEEKGEVHTSEFQSGSLFRSIHLHLNVGASDQPGNKDKSASGRDRGQWSVVMLGTPEHFLERCKMFARNNGPHRAQERKTPHPR